MTVIAERLRQSMAAKGVDQPTLAAAVGCTQGAISQILSGATHRSRFLPDIADYLGVSMRWLRGETSDRDPDADPTLSPKQMAEQLDMVPIKSIDMAYGMGGTFVDNPVDVQVRYFPRSWVEELTSTPSASLTWGRGRGNSMAPTINDNDLVLIDMSVRRVIDQDLIWAFTIGDIGMMKRLRVRGERVTILSDNEAVSDDHAHPDEINIVGRVTHIVRRL